MTSQRLKDYEITNALNIKLNVNEMKEYKAFLFDLNGTMIDDMSYHLEVWYDMVVNKLGAALTRDEVKNQLYGKNQDLLVRVFGKDHFTEDEMDKISLEKEMNYQRLYRPHLDLLPGLFSFLEKAKKSEIRMAIGSAAIPFNINFVLDNLRLNQYFDAIVSADDVEHSKPHPETFLKAANDLNVAPSSCLVFEDAPKGVEAAENAGMKAIVLTTTHDQSDFKQYKNILHFVKNYTELPIELAV